MALGEMRRCSAEAQRGSRLKQNSRGRRPCLWSAARAHAIGNSFQNCLLIMRANGQLLIVLTNFCASAQVCRCSGDGGSDGDAERRASKTTQPTATRRGRERRGAATAKWCGRSAESSRLWAGASVCALATVVVVVWLALIFSVNCSN
jgi:hypothetical protein